MRTHLETACALLLALALPGCFAEVEDKNLVYSQSVPPCSGGGTACSFQGTGPLGSLIPINVGASAEFTVDLGDQDVFTSSKSLGIGTLNNTVTLNRATLHMTTAGASFSGIQELKLLQLQANAACTGTCAAPSCAEIGTYDQNRDGPATTDLVVKGSSVNMLQLMQSGQLVLCVVARGAPPAVNWRADAALDMAMKAHAGVP